MEGGTCGEAGCQEPAPPAGMETAFGGYTVNGVYYCAMHGYGHYREAKRQQKQADWERGKAEFDRRREERQAQAEAERKAQAEAARQQESKRRGSWVDRLAAYAAHVDAVKAEKKRRP